MANISPNLSKGVRDKYFVVNNTFIQTVKSNPKDRIEIELGDSKDLSDFFPQMKLMRWDNEVNASFRLKETDAEVPQIVTEAEKIKYVKSKYEVHFYDKPELSEDGGSEFEVILKEKPASNVLEFTIQTKELDFFYQPPLTQQEIDEGASRPENVVGSYAVYHKTKGRMNDAAGMEYKVGKAFHIYRPKVTDADGNFIWGELHIDEVKRELTVTIDQAWLNNAVYPVIVDPTFGYDGTGGTVRETSAAIGTTNDATVEAGTITSVTQKLARHATTNQFAGAAIYSDSSGLPNTKLAEDSGNVTLTSSTPSLVTVNLSYAFSASTSYWIIGWGSLDTVYGIKHYYDTVSGYTESRDAAGTWETWPTPWTSDGTNANRRITAYATYTASGGAANVSWKNLLRVGQ